VQVAKLLASALLAAILLKLAGGTLEAIDSIPLLGGLLELVGLVSALSFLARNALKQQKRVELLSRIQRLKEQVLGR
jgi:predicted benzoate:H+ symporter BenE